MVCRRTSFLLAFAIDVRSSSTVVILSLRKLLSCCANHCNVCLQCMCHFNLLSCFSFLLCNLSDMVYVCLTGIAVSGFVVIVFLGPCSSLSSMKVLLFGRDAAAFIILVVLPLTTSIQSLSYCSLSFPCPPFFSAVLAR